MTKSIAILNEKDAHFSSEIAKIEPEKKFLEKSYEEIITRLNKKMTEKAAAQIELNETRDVLRDINTAVRNMKNIHFIIYVLILILFKKKDSGS